MNLAVLEVVQRISDTHQLKVRDVTNRLRKLRIEFRTETYQSGEQLDSPVLLGFSYQGFFFAWSDEASPRLLEHLLLEGALEREAVIAFVESRGESKESKALAIPEPVAV